MGRATPEGPAWGARHSLILAGFFMCVLLYSLRFNLSIAIVAMVNDLSSKQLDNDSISHAEMCSALIDSDVTDSPANIQSDTNLGVITLDWNEEDQGLVLGSFFWGYMVSQYPGGLLAHRYGAKWIISLGMLFAGLLSLAIPPAAYVGGRDLVIFVRILQGVGEGLVFPALLVLLAKWTTPQERARLSALCISGMPFGTAITMIVSGHLITACGWPSVFYVPGILTILWFVVWSTSVVSDPQHHPRISKAELEYLDKTTGSSASAEHHELPNVPWRKILRSTPFWAIFASQFCGAWGHNMLKTQGPKYLHSALHFDIHQNSYLSATPYIGQWIFCILIGRVSDYLIETNVLTLKQARKLCNTIGQWGTAAAFAGIVLAGCNRNVAVVCFIFSGLLNGATLSGSGINPIDIGGNYVGAVEGVINCVGNVAGFGAPYLAGLILQQEPTIIGWRCVFFIPVVCNIIGNSVFLLGASVKPQPWNFKENTNVIT